MIREKILYITSRLHTQFIINAVAVEIFRQNAVVVVNQDVVAVVDELRVLPAAGQSAQDPSAQGPVRGCLKRQSLFLRVMCE
jgi:hypothetical protein